MHEYHLDALFHPNSIAIIGASTEPGSVGNDLARNIIESNYSGRTYPVNPKTDTLFGKPCYPRVTDIPEDTLDLAIIAVPAHIVATVLEEAATKHLKAAIVISSGFREIGAEGIARENEILQIANKHKIALLGPNCLGLLTPSIHLNASFAPDLPESGSVALFSQSGALMTAVLDIASGRLGFSTFVSTGNKAALDERALLAYSATDTSTRVIALYSETLTNASDIITLGRALSTQEQPKPVIALKSGRTDAGAHASSSHTGALAGSDAAYSALLTQAHIYRATSFADFFGAIDICAHNPLPQGNRLAIITNAGGPGVIATDAAITAGLSIASLAEETTVLLRDNLPKAAGLGNPIDLLGDARADRFRFALETLEKDPGVDMILVIVTPQTMTETDATAAAIIATKQQTAKPIVAAFIGGGRLSSAIATLRSAHVSTFQYPEEATNALGVLARVASWHHTTETRPSFNDVDRAATHSLIDQARDEHRTRLYEREANAILTAYRFPMLKSQFVQSAQEACDAIAHIGKPCALKIVSPDIIHKTDAGGVLLNVTTEDAGMRYQELMERVHKNKPGAALEGAMVVEMATSGGKELILGLKHEPGLGTMVLVGMGGIYTEALHDVSIRFAPLTQEDAQEMIQELRSYPLLAGARGETGIDFSMLTEHILRLSQLAVDFPEIAELDINPLLAYPDAHDFRVVDARIVLRAK